MSQSHNHLNHTTWECKYHVVFTPKYRKKLLFGQIRRHLGSVFRELAQRKECQIEEGHLMPDHVHMLISIPPKYSVAEVIGFLKGKSSIWIAQNVERKLRNFLGHKFWARGYFVSTIGRDEEMIRAYIRNQEMADKQLDQLQLKLPSSWSPNSCPRILYNRLWRFPFKPPALLGVIGWTVGVAIKKAELQEAAWTTVRWAVMLSTGLSAASLLLAWSLARQITRPIDQLRQAFADVRGT
jgi:putative transposase